jgi:hypothetical protein
MLSRLIPAFKSSSLAGLALRPVTAVSGIGGGLTIHSTERFWRKLVWKITPDFARFTCKLHNLGYESELPGMLSLAQRLLIFLTAMRLRQELQNRALLQECR